MTEDIPKPLPTMQTVMFSPKTMAWLVSTFVLTPITAYYLSIGGYLPMDPIIAAISGFLVAIVYVGYRVVMVYRVVRLRSKMNIGE